MTTEYRLQELEFGYTELKDRLSEVERRLSARDRAPVSARRLDWGGEQPQPPSPKASAPQVASVPPPIPVASSGGEETRGLSTSARPKRSGLSFEDLLGGR